MAEDVAQERVADELADLVIDRRDGLGLEFGWHRCELPQPEGSHDRVAHLRQDALTETDVPEHAADRQQRRTRDFDEREERIAEDVLHARTEEIAPDLLESADDAGHSERPLLRLGTMQDVEGQGMSRVGYPGLRTVS